MSKKEKLIYQVTIVYIYIYIYKDLDDDDYDDEKNFFLPNLYIQTKLWSANNRERQKIK